MKKSIQGMSLLEVLVTLLIGTLVAAAALQILLTSTLNYNIQNLCLSYKIMVILD